MKELLAPAEIVYQTWTALMVKVVDTAVWKRYEFLSIPDPKLAWLWVAAVPGVYVFCGPSGGLWEPYYIGIARNLKRRLRWHGRLRDALELGATHVHILANVCPFERRAIERLLVRHHDPALNDRLRNKLRSGTVLGDWVSDEAFEQIEEVQREEFETQQFMYELLGRRGPSKSATQARERELERLAADAAAPHS